MADCTNKGLPLSGYASVADHRQSGSVLIIVLIVFSAVGILVLSTLHSSTLAAMMVNHYQRSQQLFQAAEAALSAAEGLIRDNEAVRCMRVEQDHNYYPQIDRNWWRQQVNCLLSYDDIRAYYVIEDLGSLDCVHIAGSDDDANAAVVQYYRITANAQRDGGAAVILQSTVTTAVESEAACESQNDLTITLGRQSWREVL